jgi:transcription-repair coupling factor (superfamily II helicase)
MSIVHFPAWETIPYECVHPAEIIERQRMAALCRLLDGRAPVTVTTVEALMRPVPRLRCCAATKHFLYRRRCMISPGFHRC